MLWRLGLFLTIVASILGRACSDTSFSTPEEALNHVLQVWEQKVSSKTFSASESRRLDDELVKVLAKHGRGRMLQPPTDTTGCGDVVIEVSADSVLSFFTDAFNIIFADSPGFAAFVLFSVQAFLTFGFQGRRVCASCSEYEFLRDGPNTPYCHPDVYAANTDSSGLVLFPLVGSGENSTLAPGTFPVFIYCHGTITNNAPSVAPDGVRTSSELLLFSFLPTAFGLVGLAPDYLGYGIGQSTVFKGFLIKQSYQTSTVPLWFKSDEILQAETDCVSALADAAVVAGYSEGGYASIAIATTMFDLGVEIISLFAGGAPVNIQVTVPDLIASVESGAFPPDFIAILALFGSAYSSTYPDIANFNMSQDVLNAEFRDILVPAVFDGLNVSDVNALFPPNATDVFDPELVVWSRQVFANGERNPCNTSLILGFNEFLCQAVEENSLTVALQTVQFPTTVCHSVNDEVVSFDNLPDLSGNGNITLSTQTGTHLESTQTCLFDVLLALATPAIRNFPIVDRTTVGGCPSSMPSVSPTLSPTVVMTPSPTNMPTPSPTMGIPDITDKPTRKSTTMMGKGTMMKSMKKNSSDEKGKDSNDGGKPSKKGGSRGYRLL